MLEQSNSRNIRVVNNTCANVEAHLREESPNYLDFSAPAFKKFIGRANEAGKDLPLSSDGELIAEPGRVLSSNGMSTVTRILLRKPDSIYLNDGLYGSFWELTANGHLEYPLRVFHQGQPIAGKAKPFTVYDPTCDAADVMQTALDLPIDISVGDHIEFGTTGAYSLSGRTDFNEFYSDEVVMLSDTASYPPRIGE
jgi:ornithine decarboxylase